MLKEIVRKRERYREGGRERGTPREREIHVLKEMMQERLRVLGIDDVSLENLDAARRENEELASMLREVRETEATFRYKNKVIMEPRCVAGLIFLSLNSTQRTCKHCFSFSVMFVYCLLCAPRARPEPATGNGTITEQSLAGQWSRFATSYESRDFVTIGH